MMLTIGKVTIYEKKTCTIYLTIDMY